MTDKKPRKQNTRRKTKHKKKPKLEKKPEKNTVDKLAQQFDSKPSKKSKTSNKLNVEKSIALNKHKNITTEDTDKKSDKPKKDTLWKNLGNIKIFSASSTNEVHKSIGDDFSKKQLKKPVNQLTQTLGLPRVLLGFGLIYSALAVLVTFASLRDYYQDKKADMEALVFLEMENIAATMTDFLRNQTQGEAIGKLVPRKGKGKYFFQKKGQNKIAVNLEKIKPYNIILVEGRYYVVPKSNLRAYLINTERLFEMSRYREKYATVYALNTSGQAVIKSSKEDASESLTVRPLVQYFIANRLTNGLIDNTDWFGFFSELPKTNVTLFAEVSKSILDQRFWTILKRTATLCFIALTATCLLISAYWIKYLNPYLKELDQSC